MEWRGVRDKPAKKREARLLTKGEQLLYSGCVKALPLAYCGPMAMEGNWGWANFSATLPGPLFFGTITEKKSGGSCR
jgi:hypothetical protein